MEDLYTSDDITGSTTVGISGTSFYLLDARGELLACIHALDLTQMLDIEF
jgi:hypothetical protein